MKLHDTVFIIDDDPSIVDILSMAMEDGEYNVVRAFAGNQALEMIERNEIDVVLLDIDLPEIDGIELLKIFVQKKPHIPVIMISGNATIERAVSTTKIGAYDFIEKPFDLDRVLILVRNALEKSHLEKNQAALVQDMMTQYKMVGVSNALQKICASASRIAKYNSPILLTGENGTGKERIAMLIHQLSGRKNFVAVNCAAVPHELFESELFGHKKGAFTGAVSDKYGKFQQAHRGTLFLDEIGDMNVEMQAKILRAIELKEVTMVGGNETTKIDVRFITATNKNLSEEIRKGMFREDLYYRLRGITLHIPPLRERREDIIPLAENLLQLACEEQRLGKKRFTDSALQILSQQEWKGNIRELKHVVETLCIFSDEQTIDHLQTQSLLYSLSESENKKQANVTTLSLEKAVAEYEQRLIRVALQESSDNISRAAEKLQIDRTTLTKKIKRYDLKT
jgi:two-component system nitrogen regulation response regulator NtrX